ncbi:beta-mannosidase [Rhodococcus sp. NPDC060086]|uniref:beta-mannosidase n=1 Tax=unclassified Rhodococcus (in: high G+C Gram-positive bacteria) TaxID=192944 RepID=UPI00364ACE44
MRLAALVACLLIMTSCAQDTSPRPSPPEQPGQVSVVGDRLLLDGREWWPTGMNAYQLATDWSLNVGCGAQVDLDAFFGSLPPNSLTRFDAFQSHAIHRDTGTVDFTGIDAVFDAAARHEQLVVPVLAPQDSDCDAGGYKERGWYVDGWRQVQDGHSLSYEEWVAKSVERWRDSPALAMWELLGEPEAATCPGGDCSLERRQCPPDAAIVLRKWTDEAGRIVRDRDREHPITLGTIGGDQCGTAGDGFVIVVGSPSVDVAQYHDYDDGRFLALRLAETEKPLLVGELGIEAGSCLALNERAEIVDERLTHYRELGAAGALMWASVPDPRHTDCSYDIGPGDPLHSVLARHITVG